MPSRMFSPTHPALLRNQPNPMKRPAKPATRNRPGFTLIITLVMMVLLTILALGLLSLSTITLRSASQGSSMAVAQNNARLALILAIGDLQKSLGPDKAVSAQSEILSNNPAKPRLTGVWESWDYRPDSNSLDYASEKRTRFRRWLVSSSSPTDVINRDFASSAWTDKTVELVGKASLGGTASDADKSIAGIVPVAKDGKILGSYAWQVSDESVKARINLYRRPANTSDPLWQKRAVLAGQRPDPTVMKGLNGGTLTFLPSDQTTSDFIKAEATTGKIIDLDQANILDTAGTIKQFRNDVTTSSLGVISNVRTGGLRQDLSSMFEMSTSTSNIVLPSDFNNAARQRLYQSTHNIGGGALSDPYWSALSCYYNTFRDITNPDSAPTFYKFPTESAVLSAPTTPRRFFPGPVIAKVEALFTYVTRDSHANWVNTLRNVDPRMLYMGHLMYTPVVTLHNPYNVNISFDTMDVSFRNIPIAFNFYVNGQPQSSRLVTLNDMFVNGPDRREKNFFMRIGNWTSPASSSTSGPIVMKPGQTLVCGPYLEPNASFANNMGTRFFDYQNNLTGTADTPINARPGFNGRCIGFDIDWLTPNHSGLNSGQQTDNNLGVLGLRSTDQVHVEYALQQPAANFGLNTEFRVEAKITTQNRTFDYGGLSFIYGDDSTLKRFFPRTYRFPAGSTMSQPTTYVPNSEPISQHALAQTVAVFSAYARTTRGGVYENDQRSPNGPTSVLLDGALAGKPFLFHNPAKTVVTLDLQREKPGGQSHELNFQPLTGSTDDVFSIDTTNRTNYLTGYTTSKGIKSGSYLDLPTGPMQAIADFRRSNALTSPFLPNFVQPVSNSWVSPLMSTNRVNQNDSAIAPYPLLDHSVLANHALYDAFYFSTFATYGSLKPDVVFQNFMDSTSPLISQAFQPYMPPLALIRTTQDARNDLYASGRPKDAAYKTAAQYQMIRGAFNVNSTSIQAWKAQLASMSKSDIISLWAKNSVIEVKRSAGTPILSMSLTNGGTIGAPIDGNKIDNARTNEWNGYRELTDTDLEALATRIVEQVRLRGPFLSMSEFVNRQIGSDSELTRCGALEAAINASKINESVFSDPRAFPPINTGDISNVNLYKYNTPAASVGNPAAGAPGWISQGDLMRILEPAATVRSDTFVVRTCGQAQDAAGNITARAYCEAVVQRVPDYIDPADAPSLNAYTDASASPINRFFGRRMKVVSFRWLSSTEV